MNIYINYVVIFILMDPWKADNINELIEKINWDKTYQFKH